MRLIPKLLSNMFCRGTAAAVQRDRFTEKKTNQHLFIVQTHQGQPGTPPSDLQDISTTGIRNFRHASIRGTRMDSKFVIPENFSSCSTAGNY